MCVYVISFNSKYIRITSDDSFYFNFSIQIEKKSKGNKEYIQS